MSDTLDAPIQTASALGYGGGLAMSDYPPGIVPPSPARASPDVAAASSPPPQKISKTQYVIGTPTRGDPSTWGQKRTSDDLVKFWTTEGKLTPIAAQGVALAAQQESGLHPMAPGDYRDGQMTSFGTYQHHDDRLAALKKYASENGLDPNDGHTQDLFALQETKTDPQLQAMIPKLNAARTPEEAQAIWRTQFEKPAAFTPNMPYAPTAWDEGKLAMGNQFLSQMMREFGEGKERVAKIDRDYKPIKVEEQPKVPDPDPLKAFGSFASLFAMVAAGFSKTPAVAAMNGMAGAINAAKEHDWEQYAAQFKAWKANTDLAHQAHEQHSKDVHDALEMMTHNIGAGRAMLESVSALARDEQMSRHLANQDYEGAAKLQMQRNEHDLAMQKAKPEAEAALMLTAAQGNLDAAMKTGNQEQIDTAKSNYDAAMQHYREIRQAPYAGRAANITAQEESAMVSRWRSEYQEREGHPPSADDETAYRLRLKGKEDPIVAGARKDRDLERKERSDQLKAEHTDRVDKILSDKTISTTERNQRLDAERERHDKATETLKRDASDETARHHEVQETQAIEKWKAAQENQRSSVNAERRTRFDEIKAGMPTGTPASKVWDEVDREMAYGKAPRISDAAARNVAEQVLAGNVGALSGFGRNPNMLAQIENMIASVAAEKGMSGADIVRAKADFAGYTKAIRDFATGKQGQTAQSLNVATQHLALLSDASKALAQNDSQTINRLQNVFQNEFGWTEPITFNAIKTIVSSEIEKAVTGSAGALADREELRQGLAAQATPQQLVSVIEGYKGLMAGQLQGLEKTYERTTKRKDFRDEFLLPEARRELDRLTRGGTTAAAGFPPVPSEAAAELRKAPETAAHFDEVFGPGAAAKVLGGKVESSPTVSQPNPEWVYRNGEWRYFPANEFKEGDVRSGRNGYEVLRNGIWSPQ